MGFFSNPVLAIEDNQHNSNYHINWNVSHQQCIQCCVAYSGSHRRDIRSPACSHPISITVELGFNFVKIRLTKVLCNILCLLNLLVIGVPLTCWMWNSSKKTGWVDFRYGSCSLSYQGYLYLISTSYLLWIMNHIEMVKWVDLLSVFKSLYYIFHLVFIL